MTIQQLYYAITIAECGSMNKASEKRFISQPTLTGAIKDLESEIGIKLFLRTHKGVTPTAEGGDFLERARSIYGQLRILRSATPTNRDCGAGSEFPHSTIPSR